MIKLSILFKCKTWIKKKSRFYAFKGVIIIIALFSFTSTYSQDSEFEYGLLNIVSGAVVGGIGAVINKKPNQKIHKVLGKGFVQGALGGYLVFESKRLLRTFVMKENYAYVWPSKVINSAGTSIIENAAANRDFWERWHLNLGFTRLDIFTKDRLHFQYRIMPFSLFRAIQLTQLNSDIDWKKSLKLGVLVFLRNEISFGEFSNVQGAQASNHISLKRNVAGISTEGHELIHVYQNNQFSGFNSYYSKIDDYLRGASKAYNLYQKIFYTDFNSPIFRGLYKFGRSQAKTSRENLFEKEAYFLTR